MEYQSFNMHFDLEMKYSTSQSYLVDKKEKELIHVLKSDTKIGYKSFLKDVLLIQSIGLEKGNKKNEHLFFWLMLFFQCTYFTITIVAIDVEQQHPLM